MIESFAYAVFTQLVFWSIGFSLYHFFSEGVKYYWLDPLRISTYAFITYYIIEGNIVHGFTLYFFGELVWVLGLEKEMTNV